MEITRSIESDELYKILYKYKEENREEMIKLLRIIEDLKDNFSIGEKIIQTRYEYLCNDRMTKLFDSLNLSKSSNYLDKYSVIEGLELSMPNKSYNIDTFMFEEYKRCKLLTQPKLEIILNKLKAKLKNTKKEEDKIINKCFVMEFKETDIKHCLYAEFSKSKNALLSDIKDYYDELNNYKTNIYI